MPGRAQAVRSGEELKQRVVEVASALGLDVETEVRVGRRVWGAKRAIDVVVKHSETRVSLGIECKYQRVAGSAEEKIAATLEDIRVWPIRGIVCYSGGGFSTNMESYLLSTGMAVDLDDLAPWLQLYFGL